MDVHNRGQVTGSGLSPIVVKLSSKVEDIVSWLFCKEEELQKRPNESELQEAPLSQMLEEYHFQEKFIVEISEHGHRVMQCKEEAQEISEQNEAITDEDRDEIGIQMDAMLVLYDKLKILTTDRLHSLQHIIYEAQRTKIYRIEQWLEKMEDRLTSSDNIGPGHEIVQKQMIEIDELKHELEQKQEFLNVISQLIVFDDLDTTPYENLEARLEAMNHRWTRICQLVDDRHGRLRKANNIWQLLHLEGPQLFEWLQNMQHRLSEFEDATKDMKDTHIDDIFLIKLQTRSAKIDSDIKRKQSSYTDLENRVRMEIAEFDDPCSMFVIELERKLEDMQDNWNLLMRKKRMIDYKLQLLSKFDSTPSEAEPIVAESNHDTNHDECGPSHSSGKVSDHTPSTSYDDFDSSPLSDTRAFENSFSQDDQSIEPTHVHQANHSCRVEDWKQSLESFSNWLREVEFSLGMTEMANPVMETGDLSKNQTWSRLGLIARITLVEDIESKINSTCQEEFDFLFLQGQQILEDLMPELGENDYEVNLKDILADMEIRYNSVKRCLHDRKRELADKQRWRNLSEKLQNTSRFLIAQIDEVIPESEIGIDLITLAQQQDQMTHSKEELESNSTINSCIQEANLFLQSHDMLMQRHSQTQNHPNHSMGLMTSQPPQKSCNLVDVWLSIKEFKDELETNLAKLKIHFAELSQTIEDRLERLDEIQREMHALQHSIQDLATKLQMAEILKSKWVPLEDLSIEQLSEQLEDLKLYRERLAEVESLHNELNSIVDWMEQQGVPISQSNLKRIDELNIFWESIQTSVEERQKLIEHSFDEQSGSEQKFLTETVADLPKWERRVATSKVPYFIDLKTGETHWDHPKFTKILESMNEFKSYVFAAYRTAFKFRKIQKSLGIEKLMIEQLKDLLDQSDLSGSIQVEQLIFLLKSVYEKIQATETPSLDVPLAIDLTLNLMLNLNDSARTGRIDALSVKVDLILLCCANLEEKYSVIFELISDPDSKTADSKKLSNLFEIFARIPTYMGESESFGSSSLIETSIRNCLAVSKLNSHRIVLSDWLNWLKTEPQMTGWLTVLHRVLISENTSHNLKCKLCGSNPIYGLRYRCLKCFKFNICQKCFLVGRHIHEHYNPDKHQLREYCRPSNIGDRLRDTTWCLSRYLIA